MNFNCFRLGSGGHVLSAILILMAPWFNHQTINDMALYDTQNPWNFQPHRVASKTFLTGSSGHIPIVTEEEQDREPPQKKARTDHSQEANLDVPMLSSHSSGGVSLGSINSNEESDEAFQSAYGTFLEGMDSDLEECPLDSESDLDEDLDQTFLSARGTFSEAMGPNDVLEALLGGSQPTISKSQEKYSKSLS